MHTESPFDPDFTLVARDESGWLGLYRRISDGSYWEESYPESQQHGGGARRFDQISEAEARQRYRF